MALTNLLLDLAVSASFFVILVETFARD